MVDPIVGAVAGIEADAGAGPRHALGRGRAVLAFDVGGTDIKSALIDESGAVRGLQRTPTPRGEAGSADALLAALDERAAQLRAQHPDVEPRGVGLVVPGIVDPEAGVAVFTSNLGWRDLPLRALAERRFGLPVAFDHDVRTASWAEHELGAARGFRDVVVIVIGTGIAGALLLDGVPHTAGGYAGEIGHAPIGDGPLCACGSRGCLETIASAGAIARRYAQESGRRPAGAKEVVALAQAGDAIAERIWAEAMDALALAIAQLSAVIAPEAVVIGGGLSRAGDALFDGLRSRLHARLSFQRIPTLIPGELQGDAGILGAALRARVLIGDR